MSDSAVLSESATGARPGRRARVSAHSNFFVGYATLLLVLLIAGFGPSFFFRALFDRPQLPAAATAHGIVLTAWFGLFLAQSLLARSGNLRLHRRLGAAGAGIAAVALMIFVWLSIDLFLNRPPNVAPEIVDRENLIRLIRELSVFAVFPALVAVAVLLRRKPETHKRLMLLATLSLVGPALTRLVSWPGFFWPSLAVIPAIPATLASFALVLAIVVIHDGRKHGRVHPVLGWGAPGLYLWLIGTGLVIPALIT